MCGRFTEGKGKMRDCDHEDSGCITRYKRYWRKRKYAGYCLVLLMLVYLVNQMNTFSLVATNLSMAAEIGYGDRACEVHNVTLVEQHLRDMGINMTAEQYCDNHQQRCDEYAQDSNETLCEWSWKGTGMAYQLLAGPLYIVMFSISGIPMGLASELSNINRKVILVVCIILWSVMTVLGGLVTQYWHIAITRILLGVFSAGCVPFCASIIADLFPPATRGAALGFYNWGVYVGYSFTFLLLIAERSLGWRAVYFISGIPGILIGLLILFTVKDPPRGYQDKKEQHALKDLSGPWAKFKTAVGHFLDPALLLLCVGGAIRNGAGFVWAYNLVVFFEEYHPGTKTEEWMTWIPVIFGSMGAFGGGYVSDKLAANRGPTGRLIVLIVCLLLSAPFQIGTLYLPMPGAFIIHIFAYLIGEMWIGVCVAVVVDIVPKDLTASSVAVYFFIIQIIGGNMPLLVPPLTDALDLRLALVICFPGMYVGGAVFFLVVLLILIHRKRTSRDMEIIQEKVDTEEEDDRVVFDSAAALPLPRSDRSSTVEDETDTGTNSAQIENGALDNGVVQSFKC